ncbi:MAG: quinolinate synthase NadA [Candidatus Margulisiibacteriota bacterium]
MPDKLAERILSLKINKSAVILAHNYQLPEVQDIADFVGDSLGLSIEASKANAGTIVFCGVSFMAETAKILNPGKKVLMPEPKAGCPMAGMINEQQLQELKDLHPKAKVVCYINSTAHIKALSDVCCTSSNAVEIVRSLGNKEIIFVPDQYLGSWVEKQLGKKLILWNGYCNIHNKILPEHVLQKKKEHPKALVMAHPECTPGVIDLADKVASTSGMVKFPAMVKNEEFIVCTEIGILHQLKKLYPGKRFYPAYEDALCPNMKLTTLEKVLWALEDEKEEIVVNKNTAQKALRSIEAMLTTS